MGLNGQLFLAVCGTIAMVIIVNFCGSFTEMILTSVSYEGEKKIIFVILILGSIE